LETDGCIGIKVFICYADTTPSLTGELDIAMEKVSLEDESIFLIKHFLTPEECA